MELENEKNYAFPTSRSSYSNSDGLTKRELFAALAMQGLMNDELTQDLRRLARNAVAQADALITELAKERTE